MCRPSNPKFRLYKFGVISELLVTHDIAQGHWLFQLIPTNGYVYYEDIVVASSYTDERPAAFIAFVIMLLVHTVY